MRTSTHARTVDLSSLAGKTVNSLDFTDEADTAAGSWAIIYEQVSLVSTDGTVFPIYTGQTSSPVSSISSAAGVSAATGLATMADFDCQIGPVEPYTQK